MKKVVALALTLCILITLPLGCSKETEDDNPGNVDKVEETGDVTTDTAQTGEKQKVRYVIPGSAPQDTDLVVDAINEKLDEDGLDIELELKYIAWDVWDQKTNLMLTTDEEFELFHVMEDQKGVSAYVAMDAIQPIDEYMDQYGDALKENIPDWMWESAEVKGNVYSVPTYWVETADSASGITIRPAN